MSAAAPPALAGTRPALRGQNLIRLEWVLRQLRRAPSADVDVTPVTDLHEVLGAAGDAAGPVLVDPRFGSWLGRLVRLIERRAPQIMPGGALRASCAEAGAFAAAARMVACRDGGWGARDTGTRIRIGADGRTPLPGAGVVIVLPRELAGLYGTVRTAGRGGPQVAVPGIDDCSATAHLVTEAVPVPGLVVPDGDLVHPWPCLADPLLAAGPPVVAVQRGASDLLAGAAAGIAVVPRDAGSAVRTAHALAASAHLAAVLSPAATTWSPLVRHTAPPPQLAEICEVGQVRRLLALRASLQELRAPGVAAVDEVITAVAEWVEAAGDQGPSGSDLLDTLREAGLLRGRPASAGPGARGGMRAVSQAGREPPSLAARDHTGQLRWRAAWRWAGGHWRVPHPVTRRFPAGAGEIAAVLAELGCPDGIEVNLLGDQRLRADPSMDHLSLMLVREPDRYDALVARLDAAADCEAQLLLTGHRAYVEERFGDAMGAYARLLRGHPYDADLWRDLTFALRHLGLPELGQTWLFHPQEVITRASDCRPDAAALNRLLPRPAGRPGWSAEARFAAGILEWVGHDPDHG